MFKIELLSSILIIRIIVKYNLGYRASFSFCIIIFRPQLRLNAEGNFAMKMARNTFVAIILPPLMISTKQNKGQGKC